MNYKAVITIDNPSLFEIVSPDLKSDTRAIIKPTKTSKSSSFEIDATDAVALRASMNTIAKSLIIFEKIKNLKK